MRASCITKQSCRKRFSFMFKIWRGRYRIIPFLREKKMSSSNSPCAACKFLRRKCTQECVFAPYFPPDQPTRFANVHRVFGASNVSKLLNELSASQREDAVTSLAYEADARLKDPVYGCVGLISILQHRLRQVQDEIYTAKKELYSYIGDQAMMPILGNAGYMQQQQPHPGGNPSYNMSGMLGLGGGGGGGGAGPSSGGQLVIRDSQQQQQQILQQQQLQQHHQQMIEAQQLAAAVAAREQQELMRSYEQQQLLQQQQQHHHHQQQQHDFLRFNSEFDQTEAVGGSGFNQMTPAAAMSPSLALGGFDNPYEIQQQQQLQLQQHEHHHHHQQPHHHPQHQIQAQLLLQSQQPQQLQLQQQQQQQPSPLPQLQQQQQQQQQHHQNNQHQRSGSDEGRSVGPST